MLTETELANYPFERSRRFLEMKPNSGHRDNSRLSCGAWMRSCDISAGISARTLLMEFSSIPEIGANFAPDRLALLCPHQRLSASAG